MKKLLYLLLISFSSTLIQAQDSKESSNKKFLTQVPKIKKTTLVTKNDKYSFKTDKWYSITDKEIWLNYFAIESDKIWTGQKATAVRVLGWWGLSENAIAYLYAIDLEDSEGIKNTSVFVSSYNGQTKGVEENPFNKNPSPTGMRGKVTATNTLQVSEYGALTLTTVHKSSNGKILTKKNTFYINESTGKMTESGK